MVCGKVSVKISQSHWEKKFRRNNYNLLVLLCIMVIVFNTTYLPKTLSVYIIGINSFSNLNNDTFRFHSCSFSLKNVIFTVQLYRIHLQFTYSKKVLENKINKFKYL